jgi:ADP-heptose:LPS heptosyltransferase
MPDLLISVDTAMAHLAGALARPCWLLLPAHMTDWRWGKERADSPWYPGVIRLFRQTERGDWGPAVAALLTALQDLAATQPKHEAQ